MSPPEEQTSHPRPTALPHTGDEGDGFSPLAAGAGVCGIVFASSLLVRRRNHRN